MALVCQRWLLLFMLIGGAQLAWSQAPSTPPAGAASKPDERVVISVGDEKITAASLSRIIRDLPPQYRAYYAGAGKHLLPQYLVQMKVLSAEALKQGLQEEPDTKEALEVAKESILADACRRRLEQGIPVSDQQVQELYERDKPDLEEVRVRHILIPTSTSVRLDGTDQSRPPLPADEARKKLEDIRQRLLSGGDFAQLAKENSYDLSTVSKGGDMGYINLRGVVPPVAQAAFALEPGKLSEVIATAYGLELIKVEDKRTKSLAEVRQALELQAKQAQLQQAIQRLESQYKVVVDTDFFRPKPAEKAKAAQPPAH